jgi:hypothetical protein
VATVVTTDPAEPDGLTEADPRAAAALRRYLEERLTADTRPTGHPYRTEPSRLNDASLDAGLQEYQSDGAGY